MFKKLSENLVSLGYQVSCFETASAAVEYLKENLKGKTVGLGGSVTLSQTGLYDALSENNTVYWHQGADKSKAAELRKLAASADIYFSSVNGISENGEIVNIDGVCNRIASIFYGHENVYFVVGKNKTAKDLDGAIYRARNIAAPLNAKRLGMKTPCAVKADKCYNCKSPERICCGLSVLWKKPMAGNFEVILINEELGY